MVSDQIVLQTPERSGRAVAVSLPCTCGCVCTYSRCPSHAHAHPGTAHRDGKVPPRTADGKFRFPPLGPSRLKLSVPLPAATGAGGHPVEEPGRCRSPAGLQGDSPSPTDGCCCWGRPLLARSPGCAPAPWARPRRWGQTGAGGVPGGLEPRPPPLPAACPEPPARRWACGAGGAQRNAGEGGTDLGRGEWKEKSSCNSQPPPPSF